MQSQTALQPQTSDAIAAVITLPRSLPTVIGMGAYLKASLCLIDGDHALVSRSAGDMSTLEAVEDYQALLVGLTADAPNLTCAAHDLHPDFQSTAEAEALNCPTLPVQHHHAHTLATAWEHGVDTPVLGLSLDGFGLGPDNESWGGELLRVDGLEYKRVGHLSRLAQPGGDIAAREPWRMAAAALHALGQGSKIATQYSDQPHAQMLSQMLDKGFNCPETSSCGRLFDAACGLLNILPVSEFEGQAPMAMEALATAPEILTGGWTITNGVLDFSPLLARLPGLDANDGANLFHGTLAAGLTDWVLKARDQSGLDIVAFGGGCFLNRVMTGLLESALASAGMTVLKPILLSPGDAGLSFGQAIAAALFVEQTS